MKQSFLLTLVVSLLVTTPTVAGDGGIYVGPDPRVPGWVRVDPAKWSPNKAATVAELIAPLLAGPLEMLDGNPEVKVHIWTVNDTFRAAVKATGLPDDSMSGEEIVIAVKEGRSGWTVTEAWKRWSCRRGSNAGKWGNKACP